MGQSVCADIQLICEKYILSERKKKKKKDYSSIWMCQITQILEEEALSGLTSVFEKNKKILHNFFKCKTMQKET